MLQQPKTSFIPKKPIQSSAVNSPVQSKKRKGRMFLSLISTLIFLVTLAAFGGVYFYKFALQKKIENQIASLEEVRKEFDNKFIEEADRLNKRIQEAEKLLRNHLSPSSLFALLEEYTLQTVSFSSFNFVDRKDGMIQITGTGEAELFQSIVLQSDSFGKSGFMRNVIFTNLQQNLERGTVGFSFSATINPTLVLYRNSLSQNYQSNNQDN